jgi:hypothetical protein
MMLANRAPTILLRILLDILNAMNRSSGTTVKRLAGRKRSSTFDFSTSSVNVSPVKRVHHVEGNPTTDSLQEIIEMLASDISSEISDESKNVKFVNLNDFESCNIQQAAGFGQQDENRTLPLVLKSLHSTDLSPPLRKVIAKLLPFLTYGQISQSKELGKFFFNGKKDRNKGKIRTNEDPLTPIIACHSVAACPLFVLSWESTTHSLSLHPFFPFQSIPSLLLWQQVTSIDMSMLIDLE